MLQFCVAQQPNETPFAFRTTGTRVYSLEEALYHVFHFWRESVDDFISDPMITWVADDLGHSYIASKMKDIARGKQPATTRLLEFLQLVDYFNQSEIDSLKQTLDAWALRREWEKLKERADDLVGRGEPMQALPIYKRALQLEKNAVLLNNIGIAYMHLNLHKDALHHLARALELDAQNHKILLHYIEAAILAHQYEDATTALATAAEIAPDCADIPFLHGLLALEQKNYTQALAYFADAIKQDLQVPHYAYKMADTHKAMRQYQKALEVLESIKNHADTSKKEAEIHAAAGDIPAAIACMRKATGATNDANLWAKLAMYHRQNYDWQNAKEAIDHALNLSPENDKVRLESARIKKGLGRMREYQAELTGVLKGFKKRYRSQG